MLYLINFQSNMLKIHSEIYIYHITYEHILILIRSILIDAKFISLIPNNFYIVHIYYR